MAEEILLRVLDHAISLFPESRNNALHIHGLLCCILICLIQGEQAMQSNVYSAESPCPTNACRYIDDLLGVGFLCGK